LICACFAPYLLNANLLGYVAIMALFGAEFLLPIYLQSLRGKPRCRRALSAAMAISGGILGMLSGRIYDRIGHGRSWSPVLRFWPSTPGNSPRYGRHFNQLDHFLLLLRGIALGLTAQRPWLPRCRRYPCTTCRAVRR